MFTLRKSEVTILSSTHHSFQYDFWWMILQQRKLPSLFYEINLLIYSSTLFQWLSRIYKNTCWFNNAISFTRVIFMWHHFTLCRLISALANSHVMDQLDEMFTQIDYFSFFRMCNLMRQKSNNYLILVA